MTTVCGLLGTGSGAGGEWQETTDSSSVPQLFPITHFHVALPLVRWASGSIRFSQEHELLRTARVRYLGCGLLGRIQACWSAGTAECWQGGLTAQRPQIQQLNQLLATHIKTLCVVYHNECCHYVLQMCANNFQNTISECQVTSCIWWQVLVDLNWCASDVQLKPTLILVCAWPANHFTCHLHVCLFPTFHTCLSHASGKSTR